MQTHGELVNTWPNFLEILKVIMASLFHCCSGQRHASTAAVHEGVGGGVGPTGRVGRGARFDRILEPTNYDSQPVHH